MAKKHEKIDITSKDIPFNMENFKSYMSAMFRQIRKDRGMTQLRFSELIGCARSMVAHIENGTTFPSQETIFLVSLRLGINPKIFFLNNNQKQKIVLKRNEQTNEQPVKGIEDFVKS